MKTRDEILATWETEGIYTEWYAIDSYNPSNGVIRRVFVGDENDASDMMRDYYSQPTDLPMQPFYRPSLISEYEAKAYFDSNRDELDERSMYTATETAGILGVSRMRVNQLIKSGKLDAHRTPDGKWHVYRYSVENRPKKMAK